MTSSIVAATVTGVVNITTCQLIATVYDITKGTNDIV